MKRPFIVCAAIWYKDPIRKEVTEFNVNLNGFYPNQPKNIKEGIVIGGHNHSHCIAIYAVLTGAITKGEDEQGFITSDNYFVDRKQAAKIAFEAGQTPVLEDVLYSETLNYGK